MFREDFEDIFSRIPERDMSKVQIVFRNGYIVAVDTVVRYEPNYAVVRGREGGTTDEGRGFFVPYDEVCTFKIERAMKLSELNMYYGVDVGLDSEDRLLAGATMKPGMNEPEKSITKETLIDTPPPAAQHMDPAQIAKNNLLARIRAARTAAGVVK